VAALQHSVDQVVVGLTLVVHTPVSLEIEQHNLQLKLRFAELPNLVIYRLNGVVKKINTPSSLKRHRVVIK